jgi:hypothetical protein
MCPTVSQYGPQPFAVRSKMAHHHLTLAAKANAPRSFGLRRG